MAQSFALEQISGVERRSCRARLTRLVSPEMNSTAKVVARNTRTLVQVPTMRACVSDAIPDSQTQSLGFVWRVCCLVFMAP